MMALHARRLLQPMAVSSVGTTRRNHDDENGRAAHAVARLSPTLYYISLGRLVSDECG